MNIQTVFLPEEEIHKINPLLMNLGEAFVSNWECGSELHPLGWGKIVIGNYEIHIVTFNSANKEEIEDFIEEKEKCWPQYYKKKEVFEESQNLFEKLLQQARENLEK